MTHQQPERAMITGVFPDDGFGATGDPKLVWARLQ